MNWKKIIKPVIMILYTILICISLPFIVDEFENNNTSNRKEAWFIGGLFVIGAVPISLWTILEHVVNYTKPYLQRHIIRILWMVPIYGLNAWFSLGFPKHSIYLDTLRECYEAYVIYNFMAFLLNFLRREYPDFGYMIEQKPKIRHLCPFCCCPPWSMGRKFINRCRHGVLQYTLIRPITTLIAFICEMSGVYHPNEFRWDGAFLYLNIINNISQVWAMYSLIMFYRCVKIELKPLKPISKFICVKFVVFLSFWQSVLFAILTWTKVIDKVESWKLYKPEEISSIFQNFFICIEMFIAAIAHHFSFSVTPYLVEEQASDNRCCHSFLAMCDVSDVGSDMMEHVKHVGHTVKSTFIRNNNYMKSGKHRRNEVTPLINHSSSRNANDNNCAVTDSDGELPINASSSTGYRSDNHPRLLDELSIGSGSSVLQHNDAASASVPGPYLPCNNSLNNHLLTSQSSAMTMGFTSMPDTNDRHDNNDPFLHQIDEEQQQQRQYHQPHTTTTTTAPHV